MIKALTYFFAKQEENYKLICLASTDTAAALIGGSTYHWVLGINRGSKKEVLASFIAAKAKLQNVDYIFIVEIHIIDCHALYTICAWMCVAFKNDGQAFRGMNIIFVGDFA